MPLTMRTATKKLRPVDRAAYLCNMGVLHTLRSIVGLIGREQALRIGRLTGRIAYPLAGRLRKKMLLNLDLAYGQALSCLQKKHIARNSLELFFANWAEIFFAGGTRLDRTMQTISIEGTELISETACAPSSSAARANVPMSLTFGASLGITARPVRERTARTTRRNISGWVPKAAEPSLMLGQETFTSKPCSPSTWSKRAAISPYSSTVRPQMFTMTGTSCRRRNGMY